MQTEKRFCESCGQALEAGAQFCQYCGAPVEAKPVLPTYTPPVIPAQGSTPLVEVPSYQVPRPAAQTPPPPVQAPPPPVYQAPPPTYAAPASQPIEVNSYGFPAEPPKKKGKGWLLALGGLGCLCVLCIGLGILGAGFITRSSSSLAEELQRSLPFLATDPFSEFEELPTIEAPPLPTVEVPSTLPTIAPFWEETPTLPAIQPTLAPSDTPPAATFAPILPGGGNLVMNPGITENSIFDDFSTTDLNWYVSDDEIGAHAYEDGGYTIRVIEPGYFIWSEVPVDFGLTTIEFDARAVENAANGIFGVLCHFVDSDNNIYVGVDVDFKQYTVIRYVDGQGETLTSADWVDAYFLNPDPYDTNHFMVVCDPDMISLYANGTVEVMLYLDTWTEPGMIALFAETYQDMGGEFKVLFDNVYAFRPAQ